MDWELRLNDAISDPAKRMAAALGGLEDRFRRLDAAARLKGFDRATSALSRHQNAMRRTNLARSRAAEQPARMRERASANVRGAGGGDLSAAMAVAPSAAPWLAVATGIAAITAAAITATAAIGGLMVKLTSEAVEMADFIAGAERAIDVLTKKGGEGNHAVSVALEMAGRFAFDPRESISQMHKMISKGFAVQDATVMLTALADLKVLAPDANIDALTLAIGQIKGKAALSMEELNGQIAEAGLPAVKVLEQIAKRMGKSVADVQKAISAGKISGQEGLLGIVAAIKEMGTGRLGEMAEQAANNSVGGLANGFKTSINLALVEVATTISKGGGMASLQEAMRALLEGIDPNNSAGAKRLVSAGATLANTLLTAIFGPISRQDAGKISQVLDRVAVAIERLTPILAGMAPLVTAVLGGMGEGFGEAYAVIADVFSRLNEAMGGDTTATLASFGSAARIAGKAAAYLMVGIGVLGGIVPAAAAALVALTAGGLAAITGFFAPILPATAAAVAHLGMYWAAFKAIPGKIKGAAGGMADAVGDLLSLGWEKLKAKASDGVSYVRSEVASLLNVFASLPLVATLQSLASGLLSAGMELGRNLWSGFVQGIIDGIAAVLDAGTRLANAAKSAVKGTLSIQSPSRVMMALGGYTAQGFAQGVDGGAGQVDASMREMVAPPAVDRRASGSSGSASFSVSVGPIYMTGASDEKAGDDLGQRIAEKVRDMLEDMLSQGGLSPTAA